MLNMTRKSTDRVITETECNPFSIRKKVEPIRISIREFAAIYQKERPKHAERK